MRTKQVMRRIHRYKTYFDEPGVQENALVLQYKHQMDRASQTFTGCRCYVPGDTIEGDALRSFASEPIVTGPIVCQLCDDASFLYDDDFAQHQRNLHGGENEYRKGSSSCRSSMGHGPSLRKRSALSFIISRTFNSSPGQEQRVTPSRALRKSLGVKLFAPLFAPFVRGRTSLNIGTS